MSMDPALRMCDLPDLLRKHELHNAETGEILDTARRDGNTVVVGVIMPDGSFDSYDGNSGNYLEHIADALPGFELVAL